MMKLPLTFLVCITSVVAGSTSYLDELAILRAKNKELEQKVQLLSERLKRETKAREDAQEHLLVSIYERLGTLKPTHPDLQYGKTLAIELAPTPRCNPKIVWPILQETNALENLTLKQAAEILGENYDEEPGAGLGGGDSPFKRPATHYVWQEDSGVHAPPTLRARIVEGKLQNWTYGN